MKKLFTKYLICWIVMLIVFNIVAFVTVDKLSGEAKYPTQFWIGYIFITISFLGQLACAYKASLAENMQKLFYNLPIVKISYTGLIFSVIVGCAVMAVPVIPDWIGAIICVIVFAFIFVAVTKASAAAELVEAVDDKVKTQTQFIKMLTVDAENILNHAKSDEAKTECKKVYEAVRYSDPMSNEALAEIENQITLKFNEFSNAVTSGTENVETLADELVALVGDRNKKCKALK